MDQSQARDQAAESVGVNPRYVSDAKAIKEESPQVFDAMKAGDTSVPHAKVLNELVEERQEEILAMPPEERKEEIKRVAHVAHNSGENEWYTPASVRLPPCVDLSEDGAESLGC